MHTSRFIPLAFVLALTACGSNDSTPEPAVSAAPAAPVATAAPADALAGEWEARFGCEDAVAALTRRLSVRRIEAAGGFADILGEFGVQPTKAQPCHGAKGRAALIARFRDGRMVLLSAKTGEVGAEAEYSLDGDRLKIRDDEGNLCSGAGCLATWRVDIDGDELVVHTVADPWVIAAWEAAPFRRVS
jgi:hypothetical protein